jgi:hypothetical protein
MAADAITWGASEYALLMTVLTGEVTMRSCELEPGGQVIELSALNCHGAGRGQRQYRERQEHQRR